MIPQGPLHPADAFWALGLGLIVAVVAFRSARRWPALVVIGSALVMTERHPGDLPGGFVDRPQPVVIAAVGVLVAGSAWMATARSRPTAAAVAAGVLASCVGVWMIVPDTEAPLIAGATVLASMVRLPVGAGSRLVGALWVLPVAAAVVGTVGMPGRLAAALAVGVVAGALGASAQMAAVVLVARLSGRAGEPTTVANGSTSSQTTAPAPTTAP